MGKSTLIAIGGGEIADSAEVLDEIIELAHRKSDPTIVVMTVATSEPDEATSKYNRIFRARGMKHVETVDISQRNDAFSEASLKKIGRADVLFFTGGDQLNVTSLLGGSPLHNLIHERIKEGFIVAGTSAGAAMMSSSMILSGKSDTPPKVGGVEIAPGMALLDGVIIDSHFSQRGRHGRLLTAVAHYPQSLGLGIDERTALVKTDGHFKVIGVGSVTVVDASKMKYSDLPYRKERERIGMFGVDIHVLPGGYKFNLKTRTPEAPKMRHLAGQDTEV